MISKLPNQSTVSSGPLWLSEHPTSLKTIHRSDYKGHFHSTKIPGPQCLIAKNKKCKVSAYLSTLPLSPPENTSIEGAGKKWLADKFESKEIKWRRGNNLHVSTDAFDVSSNYQMQFTQKPLENKTVYVPKHVPLRTMEKFNSVSTYNTDYQNKVYDRDDICYILKKREATDVLTWNNDHCFQRLPFYKRKELPPLESSTSYRSQFPTWTLAHRSHFKHSDEEDKMTKYLPFDDESIYMADYKVNHDTDKSAEVPIMSSYGCLSRESNDNHSKFVPYLEYQRPLFYNVISEK